MVKPAVRRKAVHHLVGLEMMSERRACGLIGISRSVSRYRSRRPSDEGLRSRLRVLAARYPRYGYLILHAMLRAEGLVINHKKTYRIYIEERLQVRVRKRKRLPKGSRRPLMLPVRRNQRWSLDFMSDQLAPGRRFRILNIVDDYTRECPGQIVDFSITGHRLARFLDELDEQQGLPEQIVMDNGPELTGKANVCLVPKDRSQAELHRTGQAHAKRFHRILQRQVQGYLPQRTLVHEHS